MLKSCVVLQVTRFNVFNGRNFQYRRFTVGCDSPHDSKRQRNAIDDSI